VLVLRGRGLSAALADTDPQATGVPPLPATATDPAAAETASLLQQVLDRAFEVLKDEPKGQRSAGPRHRCLPRLPDVPGALPAAGESDREVPDVPRRRPAGGHGDAGRQRRRPGLGPPPGAELHDYDFHFVHFKAVDSRGEDGDLGAKVKAIEAVDALIPQIEALAPDVMIVTGDHSTPARLRAHSWHAVPIMIVSPWTRPQADATFGERACAARELGTFPG